MSCFVICVFELIRFLRDLGTKNVSSLFASFFVRRIISQFQCIVSISVNHSLVNRWLASLFVRSSSFARRDGSWFADLHGIIIQFNAYQSIQLSLITK